MDVWLGGGSLGTQLVLLLAAFVLSAIIGVERERRFKSAGLRTHILVGLGSALFTLVSAYGFTALGLPVTDPSRIAAQVVTGIGFVGAGVIFVNRGNVTGLTTAASIWVTAAVGMACGAGMPLIAVAGTALHLVAVGSLPMAERVLRRTTGSAITVRAARTGDALHRLLDLCAAAEARTRIDEIRKDAENLTLVIHLRGKNADTERFVAALGAVEGVTEVSSAPSPPA